jgi:hypothetical protein
MGRPVEGLTGGRPPPPDEGLGRPVGPEGRRCGSVDGASGGRPPRVLGPVSVGRDRAAGASSGGLVTGRRSTGGRAAGSRGSVDGAEAG